MNWIKKIQRVGHESSPYLPWRRYHDQLLIFPAVIVHQWLGLVKPKCSIIGRIGRDLSPLSVFFFCVDNVSLLLSNSVGTLIDLWLISWFFSWKKLKKKLLRSWSVFKNRQKIVKFISNLQYFFTIYINFLSIKSISFKCLESIKNGLLACNQCHEISFSAILKNRKKIVKFIISL